MKIQGLQFEYKRINFVQFLNFKISKKMFDFWWSVFEFQTFFLWIFNFILWNSMTKVKQGVDQGRGYICSWRVPSLKLFSRKDLWIEKLKSTTSASYLDLLLSIGRDGQLHTSIYDKRDDFNFHITNFPFLSSNIPSSPAYGVFISQLIRYARACSSYECFILRARRLSSKLLKQGYLVERLKSSFRKFYGRYGDLVEQYGVTLSRMLNDILTLDQQWLPYRSDFPPISWPLYRAWPSPNYEWFPWSICNGCG